MAIKAAFFDIDGTLVSFKTHQIPASTIKAIEQAKEQGVKIFISTGRPVAIINNIDAIRHLIDGYITFNGARSFVGEEDITLMPIPETEVRAMIEDASRRDYAVLVCGRDVVALHNHKPIFDEIFVQALGVNNIDINKPVEPLLSQSVLQLTPFFSEEDEKAISSSMPHCVSARWHPNFTDITVQGADKGNALKQMSKHLGISLEECIAFGDGGNDMRILQTAGIGVAMENAYEGVKAVADYVTTSVDEDGIRNAFIHFGIINN
ncbi:Cof-type HAD-IIB family hydrolase [Prevotella melaninogenica]|uniref:Hydrolase n=1 Tax=Prevotella melaninogenica DNF00666 TaxID=1401073 RepID=A0A096BCU4_9BACT|nr:Cof-type HAD-IIB family hydrolase [Prevotella melaninogenica]KGF56940.1 hydrolase [Prevotella melaninogenica DNF00666]